MTLAKIIASGFVKDNTIIVIRDSSFDFVLSGSWDCVDVLKYSRYPLLSFTWQGDVVYIILNTGVLS